MPVIDCDTHIDETEDTWEFLREHELPFKPTTGYPSHPDPTRPPTRSRWIISPSSSLKSAAMAPSE